MTDTFNIDIELPSIGNESQPRYVNIDVVVEFSIENSGIGAYEFWGFKGYDRGIDNAVIEKIDWDSTNFTKEEIDTVNSVIKTRLNEWEYEALERYHNAKNDYAFCSDED